MGYSRNTENLFMSNKKIDSRARQFVVLIGAVIIGMIVSAVVNALPSSKPTDVATKVTNIYSIRN